MGKNIYSISQRTLHFRQPAGTSRGVYTVRQVWYVTLHLNGQVGTGECAPLPDLSCDALPHEQYEELLHHFARMVCQTGTIPTQELLPYPSIRFGLECALRKCLSPQQENGEQRLCRINGLVWMGTYQAMRSRLQEKLSEGYHCIKLKIGAIRFEEELSLIRNIRQDYTKEQVEIRVDANGAFSPEEAHERLEQLFPLQLHSIEQPIAPHQWQQMAHLCTTSPLPIALDEELIGIQTTAEKEELLDSIRPTYIVLKPSLHGGLSGCDEWIRLAEERHVGWWVTSALESNVGLADIARWVATYRPSMPQGLGTGLLYTDNTPAETVIRGDELFIL